MNATTTQHARWNRLVLPWSAVALSALCGFGFAQAPTGGGIAVRGQAEAEHFQGQSRNPDLFDFVTLPVIGAQWASSVDLLDRPQVQSTIVVLSLGPFDAATPAGTLLVDPRGVVTTNTARRENRTHMTTHKISIPAEPALIGVELAAQAILDDDPRSDRLRLTNGISLRLGVAARS